MDQLALSMKDWYCQALVDIIDSDSDSDIDLKYSHFTHSSWAEMILIKTQNIFCPDVLTCSLPSELTPRPVRAVQSEAKDRGQQPIGREDASQWLTGGDGRTLGAQRKQLRSPPNNNAKNCYRFIFISFCNKRGQDQGCLKVEWYFFSLRINIFFKINIYLNPVIIC